MDTRDLDWAQALARPVVAHLDLTQLTDFDLVALIADLELTSSMAAQNSVSLTSKVLGVSVSLLDSPGLPKHEMPFRVEAIKSSS